MSEAMQLREISAAETSKRLKNGEIILVDVREPQEFMAERIHGALLFPLSTFEPNLLPSPGGRPVVFHCGSGKRSATAVMKCLAAGIGHTTHMTGGMLAWKAAGLPIVEIDPATGQPRERR